MSNFIGSDPYKSTTFGKSLSLRVDGGFNAVSINPSGRDVVLASRQGLYVVDLDDPFSAPRWLHHITSWEVADVQWSPHPAKPYWVVSTSNQKALVWNLSRSSSNAIEHVLHGHFRAITDINFHPSHPEILATCSIDTYVHSWDMRIAQRPYYSTSAWRAGASQVKWNFQNSNIMASAHANEVFIWDLRKGCTPLHKLQGHKSSVNSIDFNRFKETEIMSSSNDGTVKFWDYSKNVDDPTRTVTTEFPVWRGRYLPFGQGYCIMPMVGGNNSVYLSNTNVSNEGDSHSKFQPVYVFKGHSDRVTDFLWRSRHSYDTQVDDREFQLVTWSKDCDLRLWPVTNATYEKVNFERNKQLHEKLPNYDYVSFRKEPVVANTEASKVSKLKETFVTKSGLELSNKKDKVNHLAWVSGVRMHHAGSAHDLFDEARVQNLGEEVSMVGHKFPKIVFEKISVSTGVLVLTLNGPWSNENPEDYIFLRIEIKFPSNYPQKNNAPVFKIEENRELTQERHQELMQKLKEIGKKYTDAGKYCLEPCLRFILGEKVNLDILDEEEDHLLNFDIADQVGFDDYSSLESSDDRSPLASDASAISEDEAKDINNKSSNENFLAASTADMAFDSTPVPKGCGAIWTPTGQLVCFFMLDNKSGRKQQSILKLGQRGFSGFKENNNPEIIYDDDQKPSDIQKRPKRYIDTISASSRHNSELHSDNDTASEESSDSFGDDWNEIMKSDITLRTKIPLFPNFKNTLASIGSESGRSNDSMKRAKNVVVICDFSNLIPDERELALEYKVSGDTPEEISKHNAQVAEKYGYEEISHCWRMIANVLIAREENDLYNFGWDQHPLGGKWFIREAIEYFERTKNVQMLAMLSCILVDPSKPSANVEVQKKAPKTVENVITFHNDYYDSPHSQCASRMSSDFLSTSDNAPEIISQVKLKYNNFVDTGSIKSEDYFSTSLHNTRAFRSRSSSAMPYQDSNLPHVSIPDIKIEIIHDDILDLMEYDVPPLLNPLDEPKFRSYRYQYGELLYYWGLPVNRAELLKYNINANTEPELLDSVKLGARDEKPLFQGIAFKYLEESNDYTTSRNCNYCGLKADRRVFVCGNCQHVLHAKCASNWWEDGDECPSGCGCICTEMFDVS
ncbi:LAFE_0H08812g1_1 [Lachancea fermentati]|uniref:LAFE_0H08812g1_1 n=1 Tax=Lachancea fermentati TaxID=4955 RepID=A0A1G4MK13_LACFM|nr:LAFE_0H08812g1_1 [Lachancea fermentati]